MKKIFLFSFLFAIMFQTYTYGEVPIRDGVHKEYYENGNLRSEISYKDGMWHGSFKTYYENGNLIEERNYVNGKLDGIRRQYDEDGSGPREFYYKNDKIVPRLGNPEELIGLLIVSKNKAEVAAAELMAFGIKAIPSLVKHINDSRESYFNPMMHKSAICEGECESQKVKVGYVCYDILAGLIENNVPKGCRYFEYKSDTDELIVWLNKQVYDSLEELNLVAAEYIYDKVKNGVNESCLSFWENRIKEFENKQVNK
ncbi:toxin-antitoxin system YwqK family antitoxin [Candidatus Omnitrophota bacterium]